MKRDLLGEVARKVKSSGDGLELGEAVDRLEGSVVGNLESTLDGGKLWKRDVGDLGAIGKDKISGLGQVGGLERLEDIGVESEETIGLLQRWKLDRADVANGDVLGRLEVGEVDLEFLGVGREADQAGGVGDLVDVDLGQMFVVGDFHFANGFQVDAVEGSQAGVGDTDFISLGNTLVETKRGEGREGLEVKAADLGESTHIQRPEFGAPAEGEGIANRLELGDGNFGDIGVLGNEAARDFLDVVQGNTALVLDIEREITFDFIAARETVGIGLVLDGGILACWFCCQLTG